MQGVEPRSQSLVERLRELPALWHLWKASIIEELGELPEGFEERTQAAILRNLLEVQNKLSEAGDACASSIHSVKRKSGG